MNTSPDQLIPSEKSNQEAGQDLIEEILIPEQPENALVVLSPEEKAERDRKQAENDRIELENERIKLGLEPVSNENKERGPSSKEKSYYEILGVSSTDSPGEIARKYRELANKYHPDKGGDAKKFKEIANVFEVLNNPEKRKTYDASLESAGAFKPSGDEEPGTDLVLKSEQGATMISAIQAAVEGRLQVVVEKFVSKGALANFIYEVDTCSGKLENLSGDLKKDSEKIREFFGDYGMSVDESTIQQWGQDLYEGAIKAKKKKEGGLLHLFFKAIKDLNASVDKAFGK